MKPISSNVSAINPALRHAADQGGANIPPQTKCARLIAGTRVYYATLEDASKIAMTEVGIQFQRLYLVDTSGVLVDSNFPPMQACGPVLFVATGVIIETIDKPEWWTAIEGERRAAQIIQP